MSELMLNPSGLAAAANRVSSSLAPATPRLATQAATTGTTTKTQPTGTSITSNDFLSLLVTEMKNQDPTQPTDPNAYIQQLVGVNSLQQLIAINGELGGSSSGSASQIAAPTATV